MTEEEIRTAEELLGHEFTDRALLRRALTHASLVDDRLESNERLEFLGDAILGMVICDYLFANYEHLLEGEMTKIKSAVVSRASCATVAEKMGLGELLRTGKGMSSRADLPRSVVSAVYEALIGALYLDGGLDVVRRFILSRMEGRIRRADRSGHQQNFKSVLQQAVQRELEMSPQYLILDEKGPDHAKCFEICVEIGPRRFPSCWGASKKQAEQQAALAALLELGLAERLEGGEIQLRRLEKEREGAAAD
jgi:ribonuclease-3